MFLGKIHDSCQEAKTLPDGHHILAKILALWARDLVQVTMPGHLLFHESTTAVCQNRCFVTEESVPRSKLSYTGHFTPE